MKSSLLIMEILDDAYLTISSASRGIFKEKGSKFLAFAFPVTSEEQVKDHLAALRKEFHDARHHCYAYRLGFDQQSYRLNDDGEPSGTAGRPIYGQIINRELTQVLIVVIRYFGGIKLGVPGLINAYRSASKDALDNAQIITKTIQEEYEVEFDYMTMNDVMKTLKECNAFITLQESGNTCTIRFVIRKNMVPRIVGRFQKISNLSLKSMRSF
jgi:uncharacterized YigZ family protein